MLTKIVMLVILALMGLFVILRDNKGKKTTFFDLDATGAMRGFWCIVIMMVHVPAQYQNSLQDMIGSFAYIGVTFFFMTSGFGLMLGYKKKGVESLSGFWLRRLPKLLIPMLLTNIITFVAEFVILGEVSPLLLISITGFVRQLLLFYFVFWLVFRIFDKHLSYRSKVSAVCITTAMLSLVFYFAAGKIPFGWPTETMGFIYGILLAEYGDSFAEGVLKKWLPKTVIVCIAALAFGVMYLKLKGIIFVGDYCIKVLLGLMLILFILCLNAKFSLGNAVSRFLGGISYEVYLLHGVAFTVVGGIYPEIDSGIFILVSILLTVILSVAVNYLSNFFVRIINTKRTGEING